MIIIYNDFGWKTSIMNLPAASVHWPVWQASSPVASILACGEHTCCRTACPQTAQLYSIDYFLRISSFHQVYKLFPGTNCQCSKEAVNFLCKSLCITYAVSKV